MRPQSDNKKINPTWAPKKTDSAEFRLLTGGLGLPRINLACFFQVAETHPNTAAGLYTAEVCRKTRLAAPSAYSKI